MEVKQNNQIPFLVVLLIRNIETNNTTVYPKLTYTGIYINWKSLAPNNWKWGTLKTLVARAYNICSNDYYRQKCDRPLVFITIQRFRCNAHY